MTINHLLKLTKLQKLNLTWILVIFTPVFITFLFVYRFFPQTQFQILTAASFLYLSTAILHHYKDKTLTLEIAIEYVLIAALALIVLQGLFI